MSEFQQGLLIAAIGMGLVFAVIIFLWGLMALMMRVTSREKPGDGADIQDGQPETEKPSAMPLKENLHGAIAAAVAVRLALETTQTKQAFKQQDGASEALSPWQTVHRNRQIEQKRTRG